MNRKNGEISAWTVAVVLGLGLARAAFGQECTGGGCKAISFSEVWKKIESASPSTKAVGYELEAAKTAADRAGRHWFPYVYMDARGYTTNDPGVSLFSTLSQRQMAATDFMPEKLNQPEAHLYEKISLGAALPLFEGGTRVAQHDAATKMSMAKEFETKAMRLRIYTQSALVYGEALAAQQSRRDLEALREVVENVIGRYKIGAKENPVGYSGLLGLKSVKNRVVGALAEVDAKIAAYREALGQMAESLPEGWTPVEMPTLEFVRKYLAVKLDTASLKPSYRVESYAYLAQAAEEAVKVERAKFLPKVGLFIEGNVFHGNRDTATSYNGGAYLQWDLFLAPNFGAIHQAQSSSDAAQSHVAEARLHEDIETRGSLSAAQALEANLKILDESSGFLSEQTKVANRLFLSGAVNALQLAEVFNRRADLIASFGAAKSEYLKVKSTLANNTNYGVDHE